MGPCVPVYLVAVVVLGVMRGSDHDTNVEVVLADRKGHEWSGNNIGEEVDVFEPSVEEDCGGVTSELGTVAAAVKANDDTIEVFRFLVLGNVVLFHDVLAKALCCLENGEGVHEGETGIKRGTQAGSTEGHTGAEAPVQFLSVVDLE